MVLVIVLGVVIAIANCILIGKLLKMMYEEYQERRDYEWNINCSSRGPECWVNVEGYTDFNN